MLSIESSHSSQAPWFKADKLEIGDTFLIPSIFYADSLDMCHVDYYFSYINGCLDIEKWMMIE